MKKLANQATYLRKRVYRRCKTTELLRQTSLQSKLDAFWHERITLSCYKEMDDITYQEILDEISRTIRISVHSPGRPV